MVNITVRNVPEATRDVLAARAAREGRSMQEYVRALLVDTAAAEDVAELFARIEARTRGHAPIGAEQILEWIHQDRR